MTKKEMFEMFNNLSDLLVSNMNTFQNKMINMFEDFKTEIRQELVEIKQRLTVLESFHEQDFARLNAQ